MSARVGWVRGKCSRCGRTHVQPRHAGTIKDCDCDRYCPLCGAEMTPFTPDMDPKAYRIEAGTDIKAEGHARSPDWTLATRYLCNNHTPPYYSDRLPVEVTLS